MPKQATYPVELGPTLQDHFLVKVDASRHPPSCIIRNLNRDGTRRQVRPHNAWLGAEITQAPSEVDDLTALRISNDDVEGSTRQQYMDLIRSEDGPDMQRTSASRDGRFRALIRNSFAIKIATCPP